jgi:hypothetical protein
MNKENERLQSDRKYNMEREKEPVCTVLGENLKYLYIKNIFGSICMFVFLFHDSLHLFQVTITNVCPKFMGPKEIFYVCSFIFSTGLTVDSFHCISKCSVSVALYCYSELQKSTQISELYSIIVSQYFMNIQVC